MSKRPHYEDQIDPQGVSPTPPADENVETGPGSPQNYDWRTNHPKAPPEGEKPAQTGE
jgi:hypothetical protein